ncbi:MAG: hypothetical protein ACLFV6_05820 [Spirulinaceae cyanobacterium]
MEMENVSPKIEKRAGKNLWITSILTFFIPFGGYIYLERADMVRVYNRESDGVVVYQVI